MRTSSWSLCPAILCVLAACAEPNAPRSLPLSPAPTLNNGNGIAIHVAGVGSADQSAFGLPPLDFHLVGQQHNDGTAQGHFRFFRDSPTGTHDFEGVVTCLSVDPAFPGRARIGGVITANHSTAPTAQTANHQVGDDVWFRMQDGVGHETVESLTVLGFAPTLVNTSAEYCALPFSGTVNGQNVWSSQIFPLLKGHLRVKS